MIKILVVDLIFIETIFIFYKSL